MLSPLLILDIPWKAECFIDELDESDGKARLRERAPEFNVDFEFKLNSSVVPLSGKTSAPIDDVSVSKLNSCDVSVSIGIGIGIIAGQTDKGKVGIMG